MSINHKKIILGLSGGIACYKAAELVRLLCQAGAEIQVVMTESAQRFITPLTLQALSGRSVRDTLFGLEAENGMNHIELARWADLILIAPASANILAKLAHGMADDLLTTLCLASKAPQRVVPAMNVHMWQHRFTARNIQLLRENGMGVWGPATGEQACGDRGLGRMLEPIEILKNVEDFFLSRRLFASKKIMITAGPTQEPLDPVRYFSNRSSGKMGYALAEAAQHFGADVILISGPTALPPVAGVHIIHIETAAEMQEVVTSHLDHTDIFIAAAAVADFRPQYYHKHKIKKSGKELFIEWVLNPDILTEVANSRNRPRCVVGFSAESEHLHKNAIEKLQKKNLDYIVANSISDKKAFGQDENEVIMFDRNRNVVLSEKNSKFQLSYQILKTISSFFDETL